MSVPETERETPAWASWFPAMAVGAWLVLQLRTWFSRDYTHDDFYFAYLSWLRAVRARPGVDFDVLIYTPLVEIFGPVFRLRPESFLGLHAGRALILLVALALLACVYGLARRLGAAPPWALCAVSIVAWQGDFLLRVGDVRTDPIATLFLLLALGLLVAPDRVRLLPAGLCFGTAVYFNIKLAIAVPALGLAVALASRRAAFLGLLRFAAGGALATLAWDGLRSLSDGWGPIVSGLRALLSALPTGSVPVVTDFLRRAVAAAPGAAILLVLGAAGTLAAPFLTAERERFGAAACDPRFIYGAGVIVFVAVFLRANPYLFPYNFVVLMPVLAPLLPGVASLLPGRTPAYARAALVALATLLPVSEGLEALVSASGRTNAAQRRVVEWIWAATAPSERVFDWQGMHWGRFGITHWWMFSGWLPAYRAGGTHTIADELVARRVSLVIDNYRLAWLEGRDREFVTTHFARLDSCLLAPGREFDRRELAAGGVLEVFVPGVYRVDPAAAVPQLLVDDRPAARLVALGPGRHTIAAAAGASPAAAKVLFTTRQREQQPLPCPGPTTLYSGF